MLARQLSLCARLPPKKNVAVPVYSLPSVLRDCVTEALRAPPSLWNARRTGPMRPMSRVKIAVTRGALTIRKKLAEVQRELVFTHTIRKGYNHNVWQSPACSQDLWALVECSRHPGRQVASVQVVNLAVEAAFLRDPGSTGCFRPCHLSSSA